MPLLWKQPALMFLLYFLMSLTNTPINSIIFSHEDGTRLGVEHLVALGHQQIALLAPLKFVGVLRSGGPQKHHSQSNSADSGTGRRLECHVRFSTNHANAE